MGLDQRGDIAFRISRGENSHWDVNEKGVDKPLASFDSEREACSYANDLAKTKQGSKVVFEGRNLIGRLSLPAHLAVRRRARRLEAAQHKADLQTWEGEGGGPVRPAVAKPPS
jgi:Uncharacterized protein conserved in bacteria (DUF2188)